MKAGYRLAPPNCGSPSSELPLQNGKANLEVELQLTNHVLRKDFFWDTPHVDGYAKRCPIEQDGFLLDWVKDNDCDPAALVAVKRDGEEARATVNAHCRGKFGKKQLSAIKPVINHGF